ncbi:MAG: right-handed parallel beta-helix repeat-containing protein, partial [Candidatus Woesearchaeota archaeon]
MKERNRTWYQLSIVVTFIFLLFFSSIFLVEKTGKHVLGAVVGNSGTNASLTLFDDGEVRKSTLGSGDVVFGEILEVHNLYNDTSNVYFYANYTNGTGDSMMSIAGTECKINFGIPNIGPFGMIANTTLNVFEYNRSFANNGTFQWNVTCSNPTAGTEMLIGSDSVRIFGPGCYDPTNLTTNSITNNTILCGHSEPLSCLNCDVFKINNENVTLDCNGTTIVGSNSDDIVNLKIHNGTIIKNCNFENTSRAIYSVGSNDNILVYNNTFANMSPNAIWMGDNQKNIIIRNNTFLNISLASILANNVLNISLINNIFCSNEHNSISSSNSNITAKNNSICVYNWFPANNTDTADINFTFFSGSIGNQTCTLMAQGLKSGAVIVLNQSNNLQNVTLNRTIYVGTQINWQVNCTDEYDNKGISALINTTYRACTVPTTGMNLPQTNVTLCPGTYYLYPIMTNAIDINNRAAGLICNNTNIVGNNTGFGVSIGELGSDVQVKNCNISRYSISLRNPSEVGANRLQIYNNSFENTTKNSEFMYINNVNISNNIFTSSSIHITGLNLTNLTVYNNSFSHALEGINLTNSINSNISFNNFTNLTNSGILYLLTNPQTNVTNLNTTVENNTFCGIETEALFFKNYVVSSSLNGIANTNTFCNSTTGNPNLRIATVSWTTDVLVINNSGFITGSRMYVQDGNRVIINQNYVNSTGAIRLTLKEFILQNNHTDVTMSPFLILANWSEYTKSLNVTINESRTNTLNNMVILNLSDPDPAGSFPTDGRRRPGSGTKGPGGAGGPMGAEAPAVEEKGDGSSADEEEELIIVEEINETYNLNIKKIKINDEILYEDGFIYSSWVMKDYETYTLSVVIQNNETGNVTNLIYSLDLPESVNIISQS